MDGRHAAVVTGAPSGTGGAALVSKPADDYRRGVDLEESVRIAAHGPTNVRVRAAYVLARIAAGRSTRLSCCSYPVSGRSATDRGFAAPGGARQALAPLVPGGPARMVGTYSSSWMRPSKVRLLVMSSATSG